MKAGKKTRSVIGLHAAREALKVRPRAVTRIALRSDYESSSSHVELAKLAQRHGLKIEKHPIGFFDRMASNHQGILLELSDGPQWDGPKLKSAPHACLVALDGIEDPMNLGAIMRTAWLLNVQGILVPEMRATGMTPTVAKVASGGAEHVPLQTVTNLVYPLKDLKDDGFWVFGLAEEGAQSLWKTEIPDKVIWVTGSEDKGIRSTVLKVCDQIVAIPQVAGGSSFNASVATAIVLAETRRQHSKKFD